MTKEDTIKRMIEQTRKHFGRIDILINNAGQGYDAPIEKTNIATFRYIFELDVVGQLIAMQEVIPIMRSQGRGSIINVSSGTALMYLPNMVSVVYPYITLTNFQENAITDFADEWERQEGGSYRPADTAEYVAQKILEGIESGEAEIFAHDWMKEM